MGVLDRIKIVEKIGQGGMAIVYRGYLNGSYGFKKEIVIKKMIENIFSLFHSFILKNLSISKIAPITK